MEEGVGLGGIVGADEVEGLVAVATAVVEGNMCSIFVVAADGGSVSETGPDATASRRTIGRTSRYSGTGVGS